MCSWYMSFNQKRGGGRGGGDSGGNVRAEGVYRREVEKVIRSKRKISGRGRGEAGSEYGGGIWRRKMQKGGGKRRS